MLVNPNLVMLSGYCMYCKTP